MTADEVCMERVPGIHTAMLLFEMGFGFDAVVRALEDEVGIPTAQAERAAMTAGITGVARLRGRRAHAYT